MIDKNENMKEKDYFVQNINLYKYLSLIIKSIKSSAGIAIGRAYDEAMCHGSAS